MSGLGKNLRELDINVPIESQKAVFGTAFDPVALDCAVVELSQSWCSPCMFSLLIHPAIYLVLYPFFHFINETILIHWSFC